jgi:hypothetical protein
LMVESGQGLRLSGSNVSGKAGGRCGPKISREAARFTLARKAAKERRRRPYRKPTQVGEERILRPTGELLSRNSAKLPRNFGRRGATRKRGRREESQATVYQKHRSVRTREWTYTG